MPYRVRVTWSASDNAFVLDPRSAALLCLADGDELVVERVVHRSCPTACRAAEADASTPPADPRAGEPGETPVPCLAPAAEGRLTALPGRTGDELATLKRALRMLGT